MASRHGRALRWVAGLAAGGVALMGLSAPTRGAAGSPLPDVRGACDAGTPYFVVACYHAGDVRRRSNINFDDAAPAIALVSDTADDGPHRVLATYRDVGAVWGLAYSRAEGAVYAGAYVKRQLPLRRGDPGAVYRIDLATGAVRQVLTVPNAGTDMHAPGRTGPDTEAGHWVGKSGLGGLAISDDGHRLLAMNLADRRIYGFALPGGTQAGSFPNGAMGEAWAIDARPFALTIHQGKLYHGVVHSAEMSAKRDDLAAYVYESDLDGGGVHEVARVPLTYRRAWRPFFPPCFWDDGADNGWQPWDNQPQRLDPESLCDYVAHPMPMLSDLAFDDGGAMVLGVRDRFGDSGLRVGEVVVGDARLRRTTEGISIASGDLLRALPQGDRWIPDPLPAFFAGANASFGGLATQGGSQRLVYGLYPVAPGGIASEGLWWSDTATGTNTGHESVCRLQTFQMTPTTGGFVHAVGQDDTTPEPTAVRDVWRAADSVGDVERLCSEPNVPSRTPTATPLAPPSLTPSATPSATATPQPTATATATDPPAPVFLPVLPVDPACQPDFSHADVALVIDASSSMDELTRAGRPKIAAARASARYFFERLNVPGDQAAVVAFNRTAWLAQGLTGDVAALNGAVDGIATARNTRIDLGVNLARAELAGARHQATNNPVMIVLTDGYNDPEPAALAIAAADAAKADGIRLFTVALGSAVDEATLRAMASHPDDYAYAPDGEDLASIYERIAGAIPCPPERFWPRATWSGPSP
jgi:hypothetical protein